MQCSSLASDSLKTLKTLKIFYSIVKKNVCVPILQKYIFMIKDWVNVMFWLILNGLYINYNLIFSRFMFWSLL